MPRGKLLLITFCVVLAGITAALPYHRAPQQGPAAAHGSASAALPLHGAAGARSGELVTLSIAPLDDPGIDSPASPAASFLNSVQQSREPILDIPEIRRDDALRAYTAAPELAPTFRPFTETIRMLRAAESSQPAPLAMAPPSLSPPPPVQFAGEGAEAAPLRRHRIADGDTLQSLAQRYYGDASQADAIFRANAKVLSDPEVLPLGAELEIPRLPAADQPHGGLLGAPQGAQSAAHSELSPIPPQLFDAG